MGAPRVRVRLVGPLVVQVDGRELSSRDLGSRKARTLLKVLLVERGRAVPADRLAEVLWPDQMPADPGRNLATLVSRLRSVLGAGSIDGGPASYVVSMASVRTDIDEAARLASEAESRLRAGEAALALTAADEGLRLVAQSDVLTDEAYADWVQPLRDEHAQVRRRAARACWSAALHMQQPERALEAARIVISCGELDEEAYRALMRAQVYAGRRAHALEAYERLRVALAEQLGADPSPETSDLHAAILRGDDVRPASESAARQPRTPLAGRANERATLHREWRDAVAGHGHLVCVAGESGIGKTRLVAEFTSDVRSAAGRVLEARCFEAERSLFLQPVLEALRIALATAPPADIERWAGDSAGTLAEVLPEIGRVLRPLGYERRAPELERRRVFEALTSLVRAISERGPVLVSLDDVHNAGDSTVEFLHFATRRLSDDPVLFVVTARLSEAPHVERLLADVANIVDLGPLDARAVRELAAAHDAAHLASAIYDRTRGHALFVIETLRAVSENGELTLPPSLRGGVLDRVRRAGPEIGELLEAGAVLGSSIDPGVVSALLDITPAEVDRRASAAIGARLLVAEGERYRFTHDLVRDVLYAGVPQPVRVARHRRAATLVGDDPSAVGSHAAAAGDWASAADAFTEAGRRAAASLATSEAASLLDRALDAASTVNDPVRAARVRLERGHLRSSLADHEGARADLETALQLARALGDRDLEAVAAERLAWVVYTVRDFDRGRELAERAGDGPGIQILRATLLHSSGDLRAAGELLERVAGDSSGIARAVAMTRLGMLLLHRDQYPTAGATLSAAVEACRRAGDLRHLLTAAFFLGLSRAQTGDLDGALAAFDLLDAERERAQTTLYATRSLNGRSWVARERGNLAHARDLARQAYEESIGPDEGEPRAHALLALADCAIVTGDDAEAARLLDEAAAEPPAAYPFRFELHRLELCTRMDRSRAGELLDAARRHDSPKYESLALAALGRRGEAVEVARPLGSALLLRRAQGLA